MAYTLVSMQGLALTADAKWIDVDPQRITIQTLLRNYQDLWLTLTHPALTDEQGQLLQRWVGLRFLLNEMGHYSSGMTIAQYLSSLGDLALPVQDTAPDLTERPVRFSDTVSAGYKLHPVDLSRAYNTQVYPIQSDVPRSEQTDLLVQHRELDLSQYSKYLLFTVNGLVHRTDQTANGPVIRDGAKTALHARNNLAGVLSFLDVGAIRQETMGAWSIRRPAPDVPYKDAIHVHVNESLANKTVILCLGGFLISGSKYCRQIGEQLLRIELGDYPLLERLYWSRSRIDLSSLGLTTPQRSDTQWSVEEVFSDQVLFNLLCLSQSFLIIVDAPKMFTRLHPVQQSKVPGRFFTTFPVPRLPLMGSHGSIAEYLVEYEDGIQVLMTTPQEEPEYRFNTTAWKRELSVDDKVSSIYPHRQSPAALLEMGRYG